MFFVDFASHFPTPLAAKSPLSEPALIFEGL